jgi:hypothetical protein
MMLNSQRSPPSSRASRNGRLLSVDLRTGEDDGIKNAMRSSCARRHEHTYSSISVFSQLQNSPRYGQTSLDQRQQFRSPTKLVHVIAMYLMTIPELGPRLVLCTSVHVRRWIRVGPVSARSVVRSWGCLDRNFDTESRYIERASAAEVYLPLPTLVSRRAAFLPHA